MSFGKASADFHLWTLDKKQTADKVEKRLTAASIGLTSFVSMQNQYNHLSLGRTRTHTGVQIIRRNAYSFYSPLAGGHLSRPEWNSDSLRSHTDRTYRQNMITPRFRIFQS